ncbi:MAG: hypothetical protein AAF430_12800 [Myxococcota bacterium]
MSASDEKGAREVLSARVSPEAAAGWRDFCARAGVSLAAFMEVAGRELAGETFPPSVAARRRMVDAAREVDRERRSRRPSD